MANDSHYAANAPYPAQQGGQKKYTKKPASQPADGDLSHYVFGKVQPQAVPLEEAVLGALMLDREALPIVQDILTADSFYLESHQVTYAACMRLYQHGSPVDLLTVTEEVRRVGELFKVAGGYYLVELSNKVASAANLEYHARIVQQKHLLRQLIAMFTRGIRDCYEDTVDVFEQLDNVEKALFDIAKGFNSRTVVRVDTTFSAVLRSIEAAEKAAKTSGVVGVPCGIFGIDNITGGFRPGNLCIVAARPGMGKTGWVLSTALHAAKSGKAVMLFSLEMPTEELSARLISQEAEVSGMKMRNGTGISDPEWQRIGQAVENLDGLPLYIDDTPGMSLSEMRSKSRRAVLQNGVQMIIVDYLQLMTASIERGKIGGNREQEVAAISRGLKGLAKELGVPVIALSQLSRAVETRGGSKRPQMSDLRESGGIENDADLVAFIYRPEYYQIMEDETGQSNTGIAEFIIGKNRHGLLDTVKMRFVDTFAKFENIPDPAFINSSAVANMYPNPVSLGGNPAADPHSEARFPHNENSAFSATRRMKEEDIPF